jgi:ubiquinone/menaquinone biosynthesis C-methylase UbiE
MAGSLERRRRERHTRRREEPAMTRFVTHDLALTVTPEERAAQDFVSSLRGYVLNDMAAAMKRRFETRIAPRLAEPPADGQAVHKAMKPDPYFRFYSALRVNAQEMVWDSVRGAVERDREALDARGAALANDRSRASGTLELDPELAMPRNVTALDVHLMPGCYHHGDGLAAGALYENGLSVFSFGLMGANLDDIGSSIALWLRTKHPDFRPERILDLGCSVGHQTLPWARTYPAAEVIGIDVAAPCLRYAHARAQSLGVTAHFKQRDARTTGFDGGSFDLIFSSMFLHELPLKDIHAVFAEAKRLLRPGGLMLHYELPPNGAMPPYDGFYLDWDSFYNAEPWYKTYRDQNPAELCAAAGFAADSYFQAVVPSIGWYGEAAVREASAAEVADDHVGRLADGVRWFAYGAWA